MIALLKFKDGSERRIKIRAPWRKLIVPVLRERSGHVDGFRFFDLSEILTVEGRMRRAEREHREEYRDVRFRREGNTDEGEPVYVESEDEQ